MKEHCHAYPDRFYAPLLALVLLATACSTDQATPTQDSSDDTATDAELAEAASGAQVQLSSLRGYRIRLYQSSCATDFAITEFVPVIGPDGKPVIGPDGQPIPARFTVAITGPCDLRPFGAASLSAVQEIVFGPDGTQTLHGEFHYTLAAGDELNTVFDGTGAAVVDPTAVAFEGWERFAGGTGQFAQARGGAKAQGSANLVAGQSEYRTLGVIGY
jgi:hypothetical protein